MEKGSNSPAQNNPNHNSYTNNTTNDQQSSPQLNAHSQENCSQQSNPYFQQKPPNPLNQSQNKDPYGRGSGYHGYHNQASHHFPHPHSGPNHKNTPFGDQGRYGGPQGVPYWQKNAPYHENRPYGQNGYQMKRNNLQGHQGPPNRPRGRNYPYRGPHLPQIPQNQQNHPRLQLSKQKLEFVKKFNTVSQANFYRNPGRSKSLYCRLRSPNEVKGWVGMYIINGFLMKGALLLLNGLSSRLYLFIDEEHEIYTKLITRDPLKGPDEVSFSEKALEGQLYHILEFTQTERVQLYDNNTDGFQGFVAFSLTDNSQLRSCGEPQSVEIWEEVQKTFTIFNPTKFKILNLESFTTRFDAPELQRDTQFLTCIINPNFPEQTVVSESDEGPERSPKPLPNEAEGEGRGDRGAKGKGFECRIALKERYYGMVCSSREVFEELRKDVEYMLDASEELNAVVILCNADLGPRAREGVDGAEGSHGGGFRLKLSDRPILKLIRFSFPLDFYI